MHAGHRTRALNRPDGFVGILLISRPGCGWMPPNRNSASPRKMEIAADRGETSKNLIVISPSPTSIRIVIALMFAVIEPMRGQLLWLARV
jgi:hypothetical protein